MLILLEAMCYGGKTTLGPLIGKELGMEDDDFKDLFKSKYNCTESEYLSLYGSIAFQKAEAAVLDDITPESRGRIISLSGSAVYNSNQMTRLSEETIIIFLNVSLEVLQKRRELDLARDSRPILFPSGINTYEELYHERQQLYARYAHITIPVVGDETPNETKTKIITKLQTVI